MAKVKAQYIGRRSDTFGRSVSHTFLINGEERYWSRVRGVWIGQTYFAETKGDNFTMAQRPERVPEAEALPVTDAQLDEWNAQDEVVAERLRARRENAAKDRAIQKLSQSKRIQALKKEIESLTKNMSSFDRDLFIRALCRIKR